MKSLVLINLPVFIFVLIVALVVSAVVSSKGRSLLGLPLMWACGV